MSENPRTSQVGLGVQLRKLREKAGMTTRSVAAALGISPSSVNRTELGQRAPNRDEVTALCALYGVTGEQKVLLIDRAGKSAKSAWFELASRVSDQQATMLILEQEASSIVDVENTLIPGLAQTAEYARLLMSMSELPGQDLENRVAARLGRQAVLSRPEAPEVRFFLDEAALLRTMNDARIMREQLEHLIVLQRRSNVSLRIVPLSSMPHPALDGSFSLYGLPDGSAHVFVEARYFAVALTEPADVEPFMKACQELDDCALDKQESTCLVKDIVGRLGDE
ncbi:helix-turn-helix transcriptional regulator [Saccharopolyspora shandongensis]|uniref:helix-turn-helix domain-containing protein n=1 Tax=Saccharopolyspora shandongensis TaxID=418495 RepID=UPI0034367C40